MLTETKDIILKRVLYRATYRGGKEADHIFKNFVDQYACSLNDQELQDLDLLLQEDDSLIFTWLSNLEDIPKSFDTSLLIRLRLYFNSLRY